MKILVNGQWCDTKTDWGYKTDEDFISHTFSEKLRLEELVKTQNAEIERLKKLTQSSKKV